MQWQRPLHRVPVGTMGVSFRAGRLPVHDIYELALPESRRGKRMKEMRFRAKCDSISYRKGFLEVALIHKGCVNTELWNTSPDMSSETCEWVDDAGIPDADVVANAEVEISPSQARALADAPLRAAAQAEEH